MEKLGLKDAHRLLMQGARAFAQMEANGIPVDVPYLDRMIGETAVKIQEIEEELKQHEIYAAWKRHYGSNTNLGSGDQLGNVLFEIFKLPGGVKTATGKWKTDGDVLSKIDNPFVQRLMSRDTLERARSTNLIGLRNEAVGGRVRPHFNQNTVITFRSSASDPNSQNFPVRDKRLAKLVRRAFIPSDEDHLILEVDFSGAEVRVATCYHKDPTMIQYIEKNHDYHKDLAMQCYKLRADQVLKKVRNTAKGGFVFASFYGDWYIQICQNLWNAIDTDKLERSDGVGLRQHLREQGITKLGNLEREPVPGTFEDHIKKIYDDFWNVRFPVYSKWKNDWWAEYLKKGYYQTKTGFICQGVYEKNKAINYPIQGSSYHCLLWSLIQIQNWLVEKKLKTQMIGQIHDSLLFNVHRKEFQDVIEKCHQVMIHDIRRMWDWIIVPLEVEFEASDKNWYEKQPVKLLPV